MDVARHRHAVTRPQKPGVAVDQRRRQQAFLQHLLRAVHVEQDAVQQLGTLRDGAGNLLPLVRRDDQRQRIQFPRPLDTARVGVHVVGDTVFADLPTHRAQPLLHLFRPGAHQCVEQAAPVRPKGPRSGQQFVVARVGLRVVGEQLAGHGRSDCVCAVVIARRRTFLFQSHPSTERARAGSGGPLPGWPRRRSRHVTARRKRRPRFEVDTGEKPDFTGTGECKSA